MAWILLGSLSVVLLSWVAACLEHSGEVGDARVADTLGPAGPPAIPPAGLAVEDHARHVEKLEALGVLGSGIAHDFNNLLAVIVASLDLADRRLTGGHPAMPHIDSARRAAQRAGEQTRKLLSFSRRSVLDPHPLHLDDVCREAIALVRPAVDPRVELEMAPGHGLWLTEGDAGELVQVLVNLILNARDVLPEGGTVRVEMENVVVGAGYARQAPERRAGEFVCVRVRDDGPGMTSRVQARIFEPFFTTKEAGRGTGLGLAMAYGTLRRHRGWIDCHSVPGQGTTFSLYLPRHARASASTRANGPISAMGSPRNRETILVVQDQAGLREISEDTLSALGHEVLTAADGRQALEMFQAARDRIRLVVLDMSVRGLNGRDTLAALRAIDPQVRVLLTDGSPSDMPSFVPGELDPGAISYLQGPSHIGAAVHTALKTFPAHGRAHSSRTTS